MGQPNLTDEQFEVLAQYYKDPKLPSNVKWTGFLTDTEMGEYWIELRLCVLALGHSCDVYSLLGKFKDLVLFLSTLAATKLYFTAQFKPPSPQHFPLLLQRPCIRPQGLVMPLNIPCVFFWFSYFLSCLISLPPHNLVVFTRRGLEKTPTYTVPAMETFQMSRPGAGSEELEQDEEVFLERIKQRMRRKLTEQRILSKPCFQDFDKWVYCSTLVSLECGKHLSFN